MSWVESGCCSSAGILGGFSQESLAMVVVVEGRANRE